MTVDEFVTTLRKYRWQEPQQPFIVELTNGEQIFVDDPRALGFIEGDASFISSQYEFVEFSSSNVRAIRPVVQGASS